MWTKSCRCAVDVGVSCRNVAILKNDKCAARKRVQDSSCRQVRASTGIDRQPRFSELHSDADDMMCARTCGCGWRQSACIHVTGRKVLEQQTHISHTIPHSLCPSS